MSTRTQASVTPRAARAVADEWDELAAPTAAPRPFDPDAMEALPPPIARWMRHAIEPGTPLTLGVQLAMHGQIRIGAWRPFTARQVLAAQRGFIWAARATVGRLPVTGFDRYVDGQGENARARVEVDVDGTRHEIEITVDDVGRPVSATMPRWGNPLSEPFGLYPFGALFTGERRSGGVLMSDRIEAGWFAGTERWRDGVFFRAAIDEVLHR